VVVRLLSGLLLAYLAVPVVALLPRLSGTDLRAALSRPEVWQALGLSLSAATIAAVVAALLGVPLGFLLARGRLRFKNLIRALVLLPLVLPPVVGGLLLMLVVGPRGPVGRLLEAAGIALVNTRTAVVLAQVFAAAPFIVVTAESAFRGVDVRLEKAAANLGRPPGYVFRRVSLPLARTGLVAGLMLGWLRALGEFGTTAVLAYHPPSLPVFTWVTLSGEGLSASLPLAVLSLTVTVVALVLLQWLVRAPAWQRRSLPAAATLGGRAHEPGGAALQTGAPVAPPAPGGPPATAAAGPQGGLLELDLTHRLGGFTLDVALRAEREILVLFGPSGSGKTTLLHALAGLLRPHTGRIAIDGEVLFASAEGRAVPAYERRIATVFQEYALFPHLTVMGNVLFGVGDAPEERRQAAALLRMCRLEGLEDRYPHQLSGGQQQRVALARALVTRPRVLLLDEPFSALDSNVREKLQGDLLRLQRSLGLTVIHVTHDLAEALVLADRIAVLHDGHLEQLGDKDEVLRRPATEAVARFMGMRNLLPAEVVARTETATLVRTASMTLWAGPSSLAPGTPVLACIRPQEVVPLWSGRIPPGSENAFLGLAVAEEDRGLVRRVHLQPVDALGTEHITMDVPAHEYRHHRGDDPARAPGDPWTVLLPPDCLHVVPLAASGVGSGSAPELLVAPLPARDDLVEQP